MTSDEKIVSVQSKWIGHGFTQFWNVVLLNSRLSLGARMLHATLSYYARQSNQAWPGQPKLAEQMGVAERTVRDYLRELETCGLVATTRRRNTSNLYRLLDPSPAYMAAFESADIAGSGLPVPADISGTVPAESAAEVEAVEVQEEEVKNLGDQKSPSALPGLEAPTPVAKSDKQREVEEVELKVEQIWAYWSEVFPDRVTVGLTDSRRRSVRKAVRAVGGSVEICNAAIDGLKQYRATVKPGEIGLSVIFETNMKDRSNLTEKIEWWASQAPKVGQAERHVSPLLRQRITDQKILVVTMLRSPTNESARERGEAAAAWLRENAHIEAHAGSGGAVIWKEIA